MLLCQLSFCAIETSLLRNLPIAESAQSEPGKEEQCWSWLLIVNGVIFNLHSGTLVSGLEVFWRSNDSCLRDFCVDNCMTSNGKLGSSDLERNWKKFRPEDRWCQLHTWIIGPKWLYGLASHKSADGLLLNKWRRAHPDSSWVAVEYRKSARLESRPLIASKAVRLGRPNTIEGQVLVVQSKFWLPVKRSWKGVVLTCFHWPVVATTDWFTSKFGFVECGVTWEPQNLLIVRGRPATPTGQNSGWGPALNWSGGPLPTRPSDMSLATSTSQLQSPTFGQCFASEKTIGQSLQQWWSVCCQPSFEKENLEGSCDYPMGRGGGGMLGNYQQNSDIMHLFPV